MNPSQSLVVPNKMDVFIVPEECSKLLLVNLPSAKDPSKPQSYLCDEENFALYEIIKYSDQFRSWFIDNLLCKEGHMNMLSKVDPLFVFVPHLITYASKQFRSLEDICHEYKNNYKDKKMCRLECALKPDIDWQLVCDTQELDNELYVRFSELKTIEWLMKKHERLCKALESQLDKGASRPTVISHATDLLDSYIPTCLSDKFKTTVKERCTFQLSSTSNSEIAFNNKSENISRKHGANFSASSEPNTKRQQQPRTLPNPQKTQPKNSILNYFKKT